MPDPVDLTNALHPRNDSERLLFRNLSESLIRLDCREELRPGLAEVWSHDSAGTWALTLRDRARFGSARRVSAADVVSNLASARTKGLGIDSASMLNGRQLRVFFSAPNQVSALRVLADPALAIGHEIGTQSPAGRTIDMTAQGSQPLIQIRFPPLGDPRDALDRGADLIVSRHPELIEYAAGRPEFATFALPWSRTYVLVQPASGESLGPATTDGERRSLARDAVEADARVAEPPFWWEQSLACPTAETPTTPPAGDRIAYVQGDEVARALAERLVALAGPGTRLRIAALDQSGFAAALRAGSERAYVLALPKQVLDPCPEVSDLPGGARIQPLIESRAHAIVRRGAPPLMVEWDGTVRVAEP